MHQPDPNTALLDLLVEWEDRRAAGDQASVETLCAGRPQLADGLRAGIAHLAAIDGVLADDTVETDAVPVLRGFEIRSWLGGGGMGDVYLARDKTLARQVAVKIPKPEVREVARGRFEREGQTLARLRHADIVTVFAAGVTDAGVPYLVMDYIPGGTLADRLRGGTLSPAEAARVGARVARAVHHAHQKGIIHRDLKPSNIFFAEDGSPRVGDFGVAAVLAGESAAVGSEGGAVGRRLTATAGLVGTPTYCAPELFAAAPVPPAPAADVWALGVVLYQAVTGELPFDGADEAELKRAVAAGAYRAPHEWNPAVPVAFAAVIGRCLATNPEERYTSAEDLAVALDRWQRASGRTRRVRQWAGGIAAAVLLAILTGAALRPLSDEERHARACDKIAKEMAADDDVVLVPPSGPPRTARVRLNEATQTVSADGLVAFDSRTTLPVLVELAADPGVPAYRLTAELNQLSGFMLADVGLYVCHAVDPITGVNEFLYLRFSDQGDLAVAFPGPGGVKGGLAQLRFTRAAPPAPAAASRPAERMFSYTFWDVRWECPPPPAADVWRTLVFEVTPDVIRCQFDGRPTRSVRVADSARNIGRNVVIDTRGGLGVYLCHSSVAVRNCVLKPLLPSEVPP